MINIKRLQLALETAAITSLDKPLNAETIKKDLIRAVTQSKRLSQYIQNDSSGNKTIVNKRKTLINFLKEVSNAHITMSEDWKSFSRVALWKTYLTETLAVSL